MEIDAERYQVMDALTSAELVNIYSAMTPSEKVDFIKELVAHDALSVNVARLVLADKTRVARIALARYSNKMQYLSLPYKDNLPPELDLEKMLLADNDELVKCALYENPKFLSAMILDSDAVELFKQATAMERLALMRNSSVRHELVLKIYDYESKDIVLDDLERFELIWAFSTNKELIEKSKMGFGDHDDAEESFFETDFYNKLWDAALRWAEKKSDVLYLTFKNFGVDEKVAIKAYDALKDQKYKNLRTVILENPRANATNRLNRYNELFKKGLEDEYGWVRHTSAANLEGLTKVDVKKLLSKSDIDILCGLLHNKRLDKESMCILKAADKSSLEIYDYRDFLERYEKLTNAEHAEEEGGFLDTAQIAGDLQERFEEKDDFDFAELKALILNVTNLHASIEKRFEKVNEQLQCLRSKASWIFWILVALVIIFIAR